MDIKSKISHTSNVRTVYEVLFRSISHISANTTIIDMFGDDKGFIFEIIKINSYLEEFIEKKIIVETLIDAIAIIKKGLHLSAVKLRKYQRSTDSATPKNIFLNKIHNTYGLFLLELNQLLTEYEVTIHSNIINEIQMKKIIDEPYSKQDHKRGVKISPENHETNERCFC